MGALLKIYTCIFVQFLSNFSCGKTVWMRLKASPAFKGLNTEMDLGSERVILALMRWEASLIMYLLSRIHNILADMYIFIFYFVLFPVCMWIIYLLCTVIFLFINLFYFQYVFGSLMSRDNTYKVLFSVWKQSQNAVSANGVTIPKIFTAVRIWIENGLCKISRKSVQNWRKNRRKSCDPG